MISATIAFVSIPCCYRFRTFLSRLLSTFCSSSCAFRANFRRGGSSSLDSFALQDAPKATCTKGATSALLRAALTSSLGQGRTRRSVPSPSLNTHSCVRLALGDSFIMSACASTPQPLSFSRIDTLGIGVRSSFLIDSGSGSAPQGS
eukprot:scaffold283759_cov31-Tisochrysis_lutea.AAC.1